MSRRKTSNPISLFSFQDIITSVTGIMILVTLLIALELSQRALDSPRIQTTIVSKQLETAVAEAEEEIRELESQLAERDTKLQELAAYDRRRILAESVDANRQIEQLEAETIRLASQGEDAQKRKAEMQSREQAKQQDIELVEELNRKCAELREQIEKLQASNRIIYNPAQGTSKTAWLVELTGQAIRIAPMGRIAPPVEFIAPPGQALADFRKWSAGRDNRSEYFVLLIKSSGIELFDQLQDELAKRGFDIGYDVVDEQVTVIDPQVGAGI